MSLQTTLNEILETVAFLKDDDGNDISILGRAKIDLNDFLDTHTSISDDEKAKRIYDFFTNTITNVTVQAIQVAGQAPLQEAQIQTMQDETAQKIASMQIDDTNKTNESVQKIQSMQNDDKAKLNNSAVNVAKAKAEIETLIPAQVNEINKNVALKDVEIATETKKLDIADKDILIKQAQISLEEAKLPLYNAQTDNEIKKLDIADKDILLKQAQVGIEEAKIPLYNAQADNERAKIGLTAQQVRVSATEVQYKLAQLKAIQKAGDLNKEIEDNKNLTQIKIAKIYKA